MEEESEALRTMADDVQSVTLALSGTNDTGREPRRMESG